MNKETKKNLSENLANAMKPLIDMARDFTGAMNPKYEYFVLYKNSRTYDYHTWDELIDLINEYGKNSFIIFKREDEIILETEISIKEGDR